MDIGEVEQGGSRLYDSNLVVQQVGVGMCMNSGKESGFIMKSNIIEIGK